MEHNKKAFTLIELLVVVLIIGILATVAVPQYQKTVRKAYYAQMLPILRAVVSAEEVYYLSNGEYTNDFDSLDVDIPMQGNCHIDGSRSGTCRIPSKNLCICLIAGSGPAVSIGFQAGSNVVTTYPSGYEYLFDTAGVEGVLALKKGLYCREHNLTSVARTDNHCTGALEYSAWFGSWFKMDGF